MPMDLFATLPLKYEKGLMNTHDAILHLERVEKEKKL